MGAAGLHAITDSSPASWIAPRLSDEFGAVATTVPGGFAAYVRICHPVLDGAGEQRDWSQVAASTGRRAHALMQWHALVGSSDPLNFSGSLWDGERPDRGNLDAAELAALCGPLREATETPEDCYFCLWEGYGWLSDDRGNAQLAGECPPGCLSPPEMWRAGRLHLPGRDYLVFAGALAAALLIGHGTAEHWWPQSPNIFWPADRAWCVASEIDFDSTLVGGEPDLIRRVLETPELDAWEVGPHDSLAADGDAFNWVPEWEYDAHTRTWGVPEAPE